MDRAPPDDRRMERRMVVALYTCFIMMVALGITDFFGGLALRNQEAPLRQIGTMPLWRLLLILFGAWLLTSLGFIGATLYLYKLRPFWTLVHIAAVLLMLAYFTHYLHFEPFDFHIWGPLAVDLGLTVSIGIKSTYFSADRGLLRRFWSHVNGSETEGGGDNMELAHLDLDGRHSDSRRGPEDV